jgi:hypothetical protein
MRCRLGHAVTDAWNTDPRVSIQRRRERIVGESITAAHARGTHRLLRGVSGCVGVSRLMVSGRWRRDGSGAELPRCSVIIGFPVPGDIATLIRCPHVRLMDPREPIPGIIGSLVLDLRDPAVDPAAAVTSVRTRISPTREDREAPLRPSGQHWADDGQPRRPCRHRGAPMRGHGDAAPPGGRGGSATRRASPSVRVRAHRRAVGPRAR